MTEEKKICKKCGLVMEKKNGKACRPCDNEHAKEYNARPEVKARVKEWAKTPKAKQQKKQYFSKPETRERMRKFYSTPEQLEKKKQWYARMEVTERRKQRAIEYYSNPENKDVIIAYRKNYYLENADQAKEKSRIWYLENKELANARQKEYYHRPEVKERTKIRSVKYRALYHARPGVMDRIRQRMGEYHARPEVKQRMRAFYSTPEQLAKKREWGLNNPSTHWKRARNKDCYFEVGFSRLDIFKRDKFTCEYCKKKLIIKDCVLEHRIPIAKGGAHVWENCTTSCQPCNQAKAAKLLTGVQITIFDKVKE
jgi:5-methylcytosine-specific restriction endonuclease McrA